MGKGNKSLMGFDLKVFLLLSMALNVVLISKVLYQEDEDQENKISTVCLDTQSSRYGDAHVSRSRTPFHTTTSTTDVVSGGDGVIIDLDQ